MRSLLCTSISLSMLMVTSATPHPECDPCSSVSEADLNALTIAGKYLCCDLTCAYEPKLGCGVFGLPLVCKACYVGEGVPAFDDPPLGETPSPASASFGATGAPVETEVGVPKTEPPVETSVGLPETWMPVASGPTPAPDDASSFVGVNSPAPTVISAASLTPSPVSAGLGTPSPAALALDATSSPLIVPASTLSPDPGMTISMCTADEEAQCADLSAGQREALSLYDNGGKTIVCDPTCDDGYSDPIHCNYFGLGQKCRGCGTCSDCTSCPSI